MWEEAAQPRILEGSPLLYISLHARKSAAQWVAATHSLSQRRERVLVVPVQSSTRISANDSCFYFPQYKNRFYRFNRFLCPFLTANSRTGATIVTGTTGTNCFSRWSGELKSICKKPATASRALISNIKDLAQFYLAKYITHVARFYCVGSNG